MTLHGRIRPATIVFAAALAGCGSVPGNEFIRGPVAREHAQRGETVARASEYSGMRTLRRTGSDAALDAFYAQVRSAAGGGTRVVGGDGTVRALFATSFVQKIAGAAYDSQVTGRGASAKVTRDDAEQFLLVLAGERDRLLRGLADGAQRALTTRDQSTLEFGTVLLTYLRAYADGSFTTRQGTNLSKPEVSSGLSDEDIQGLVTVFFEAFYDCLYEMPLLVTLGSEVKTVDQPEANPAGKVDGSKEPVTRTLQRVYRHSFVGAGTEVPTASKIGFITQERVDQPGAAVSESEAKAIERLAVLVGRQSKSVVGTLFGFLSNVNVSVVFGADFAIGDNKTLLNLVQTAAEVSARRSVEYTAYRLMVESIDSDSAGGRAIAAGQSRALRQSEADVLDAVHALQE